MIMNGHDKGRRRVKGLHSSTKSSYCALGSPLFCCCGRLIDGLAGSFDACRIIAALITSPPRQEEQGNSSCQPPPKKRRRCTVAWIALGVAARACNCHVAGRWLHCEGWHCFDTGNSELGGWRG
jgi:hypothetical protein